MTPDDARFMKRAIRLSRKGFPAPNPHVGCVIVRNGEIVGEGYHSFAGGPHAERVALDQAGDHAFGADVYVTLEPCNHYGRTPPCSLGLIEARVRRVVIACLDPNPKAAGGARRLREAGIFVEEGLLREEAEASNVRFMTAMRRGRPHVTIKAAASLDGRIALPSGESQWITGPAARRMGQRLRAEAGAVLVGRRTVELDDPLLTARLPGVVNQPLRVVLDPSGRLTGRERVFNYDAETLHITGKIELLPLLESLAARNVTSLLVEGGAATIGSFVRGGFVDLVELFLAPKLLGDGLAWLSGLELASLGEAPRLAVQKVRRLGSDLWITAAPVTSEEEQLSITDSTLSQGNLPRNSAKGRTS